MDFYLESFFHSDKGSQYSSDDVKKYLKLNNFHQSMSNDCYENSITETFFCNAEKIIGTSLRFLYKKGRKISYIRRIYRGVL